VGDKREAKDLLTALAREGDFGGEPSLLAAPTFVADGPAVVLFYPLLFLWPAKTSKAALSNSLLPPKIIRYDCVGLMESVEEPL